MEIMWILFKKRFLCYLCKFTDILELGKSISFNPYIGVRHKSSGGMCVALFVVWSLMVSQVLQWMTPTSEWHQHSPNKDNIHGKICAEVWKDKKIFQRYHQIYTKGWFIPRWKHQRGGRNVWFNSVCNQFFRTQTLSKIPLMNKSSYE